MSFSKFAIMLHQYHSPKDNNIPEYVLKLTGQLMKDDGNNTLIDQRNDVLNKIYNGKNRNIPKCDARIILNNMDKTRFKAYLNDSVDDVKQSICKSLWKEFKIRVTVDDFAEKCAISLKGF